MVEKNHTNNVKHWRGKNPEKYKAHIILNDAIKNGEIIKSNRCEVCNKKRNYKHITQIIANH